MKLEMKKKVDRLRLTGTVNYVLYIFKMFDRKWMISNDKGYLPEIQFMHTRWNVLNALCTFCLYRSNQKNKKKIKKKFLYFKF